MLLQLPRDQPRGSSLGPELTLWSGRTFIALRDETSRVLPAGLAFHVHAEVRLQFPVRVFHRPADIETGSRTKPDVDLEMEASRRSIYEGARL